MTKQDRELAYLMKAVREYNEIAKPNDRILLNYTGFKLEVLGGMKWIDDEYEYEFQEFVDFSKIKYTRGCNMIRHITDEIKKEGERL